MVTSAELRSKYLAFFEQRGHAVLPSAPLVPLNDPTVLFTTAGMHPLVPFLLGEPHPAGTRLTSIQKCIRTGDIDDVGDDTHLTFFEMMGNWSLGDYFKEDAIRWSFEFLTSKEQLGIPVERLAVSCFAGDADAPRDEEAASVWRSCGIPDARIAYLPKENNWWGPAGTTGPCGPDTEMFFWIDDTEPAPDAFDPRDTRWVEIWNDVFMQYRKTETGTYELLAHPNVDTGMGLERTLTVLNGKRSVYETELFTPLLHVLREQCTLDIEERSLRIIADHMRAAAFIIADGVEPSNKDRGYVLRRLLRRSMVYARQLGMHAEWHRVYMNTLIGIMGNAYPELLAHQEHIVASIAAESDKFGLSLEKGLRELEKRFPTLPQLHDDLSRADILYEEVTENAFDLYQSYGLPLDIISEVLEQRLYRFDKKRFAKLMDEFIAKHKELSRTASAGAFKGGLADNSEIVVRYHTATHLLNAALRAVLGTHVMQKGSNITAERTRFDFAHPSKVTADELAKVQAMVNDWIARDLPVTQSMMSRDEAIASGAVGAFGEKYGDMVSVYSVGSVEHPESREFCGGPHVTRTSEIGAVTIIKEEAVSAGVRRIKAVIDHHS